MKLATLRNGTRDGRLVVVSRDLTRFTDASFLVPTLQAALDDWRRIAPHLMALSESLEHGSVPAGRFHEHDAHSPLPRAYQRLDGRADPDAAAGDPAIGLAASAGFTDPRAPLLAADEDFGIGSAVAAIVDDVPMGTSAQQAGRFIRLLVLTNDATLNAAAGPARACSYQSNPASALSPVAVTPDELGDAWAGGKVHLPLIVDLNSAPLGRADAAGMRFDFGRLIALAARTRPLVAGTIVASGNSPDSGPPADGQTRLRIGDVVRIEMKDRGGHSIFGAIEQRVERFQPET